MLSLSHQLLLRQCNTINNFFQRSVTVITWSSTKKALSFFHSSTTTSTSTPPRILWTTHLLQPEQIVKVDSIFHKLLWLDVIEISMLTDLVNQGVGIVLTPKQRRTLQFTLDARRNRENETIATTTVQEKVAAAPKAVTLKLVGYDEKQKIKIIKEVRSIAGLGLKEAKELVENTGVIQKDVPVEQANDLKQKLEAIGAQIELL